MSVIAPTASAETSVPSDPTPARPPLHSRLWEWCRWPVAIAALVYLVYANVYQQWDQIGPLLERGVSWWAFAGSGLAFGVVIAVNSYRWYLLVRAQGFEFEFLDAVRLNCVGMLFNFVAPGSIGGDLVKAAMIAQRQASRRLVAASTVVLDRMLGMLALLVVGFVGYQSLPPQYHTGVLAVLGTGFGVGAAVGVLGLCLALVPGITTSDWVLAVREWPYVGRFVAGILDTLRIYQQRWQVVAGCAVISLVSHAVIALSLLLATRSLASGSLVPSYRSHAVVMCGANFGAAFVPVPGGVGALEGAIAGSFDLVDRATTSTLDRTKLPPEWTPAVKAFRTADDGRLEELAARYEVDSPAKLDADLARLETADEETVVAAVAAGLPQNATVSSDALVEAYRSGHASLASGTGLLAGLVFRVQTILVAIVGGLFYLAGRREIDAVIERAEHPEAASS